MVRVGNKANKRIQATVGQLKVADKIFCEQLQLNIVFRTKVE